MRLRRLGALCLALLTLGGTALATTAHKDESLVLGMVSVSTQRTNPLLLQEREFMGLTALVYGSLVVIDDDYMPKPGVAENWEASPGGGTWTFTLREGVYFHDGSELTSADVVATVNEILRLGNDETNPFKGVYSSLKYFIASISAGDPYTVEIRTNRANRGFLYAMTFPILPEEAVQADNPPGTGPFVMSSFVPADYMQLTANPLWWDGTPALKEIMTIFHSGSKPLISSYEYNRVDAIATRSLTAAQYRSGMNSLHMSYRTKQLETLLFNTTAREFTDVNVRRAVRYAINVDAIANSTYMGLVARTNTPMISGTWTHQEPTGTFEFNPEKARRLLEEAGWTDVNGDGWRYKQLDGKLAKLSLRFVVYEEVENSVRISTAHQIANMLQSVGIEARVQPETFENALARLKAGSFDMALAAYNMDVVPDPGFLLMKGNTGNYMRYSNERMDQLFTKLRQTMDQQEYQQTLFDIQALYAEDVPFITLFYRNGAILTRRMFTKARSIREPDIFRGIEEGIREE